MGSAVIVEAVRTPIGRRNGWSAEVDALGPASQQKAAVAWAEGRFEREVVPVEAPVAGAGGPTGETTVVSRDRGLRAQVHGADLDRVNVNGGAIALGHPVGASGARLLTTAPHEMERRDASTALVTMCCGGALATATIVERR